MTCPAADYLNRKAERLVVEGYRKCLTACAGSDPSAWDTAYDLYAGELGASEGRVVMDGLGRFVAALGRCATCPLRFFPSEACHLCRDECLVLSLVAALQHGDDDAGRMSAQGLACQTRCTELTAAASDYAMRLKVFGLTLLPIPPLVVADFLAGPARESAAGQTLH